ncbi:MAG TPA: mycofactocin precursor MftA [Acidimicrobiales bacterium]|nr:mycofactocin precursor MftA [Acidimicrobiales bacterium]
MPTTPTAPPTEGGSATDACAPTDTGTAEPPPALVAEDLLVEDVSIDGMCGVY